MSSSSLIAAVCKRKPLWDPTDVHHHNRVVVAGLWREIGQELGINMMLAKSKWRGLRDYYRQQLRRSMDQPDSSLVSTSWAHFEEMSFLGPSMSATTAAPARSGGATATKEEPASPPEIDLAEAMEQNWSPQAHHWAATQRYQDSEVSDTDEDDLHFFRSLLPDLRGISRAKKTYIRLQIQRLIYTEVYGGHKSPVPSLAEKIDKQPSDNSY